MGLGSLMLSTVVGIAALGASSYSPDAQARGSVSVTIGSPAPYYGNQYGGGYGGGYDHGYGGGYNGGYDRGYGGGYNGGYDRGYGGGYDRGQHRPGYALVPGHWAATHHGRVWVPASYVRVHHRGYQPGYGGRVVYRSAPVYRHDPRGYHDPHYNGPRRGGW